MRVGWAWCSGKSRAKTLSRLNGGDLMMGSGRVQCGPLSIALGEDEN